MVKSIKPVELVAGKRLIFAIPEQTFYDQEDGTTQNLQLSLNITSPIIIKKCWFTFNSTSQILNGLPYAALLGKKDNLRVDYQLTATDSCGLSIAENMSLILKKPARHCFEMTIAFKIQSAHDCEWIAVNDFVAKVAAYYGFNVDRDISVIDYARSKKFYNRLVVKLSFSQRIIKCDHCDSTKIANITYKVLHKENSTVHSNFSSFVSPSFETINILITGVDTCAAFVLPLVQEEKSTLPVLAWLLPVIVFSVALALTLLFALCRYCGCCSCCVCICPADEDEDYFMRKECPPRRHHTYREFIGSDYDQVYPSLRKNRAGQMPTDTSIESADELIGSGSDDGILPLPPLRGKREANKYGTGDGSRDSTAVTTIIYATPPVGKETTEMSVFSGGGGTQSKHADGVNVMYHNVAETTFQSCDDDEYNRAHGSIESLIHQRASSSDNIIKGYENPNANEVAVDLSEYGISTTKTSQTAGAQNNTNVPPIMGSKVELESTQKSSPSGRQCGDNELPGLFDASGGAYNPAYDTDDDIILQGQEIHSSSNLTCGSYSANGSLKDNARLSFEGDISTLSGEKDLSVASTNVGTKHPQINGQGSISNRGLIHGDLTNTSDTGSQSTIKGRRNAMKTNSRARTIITGVDNDGLLCDEKCGNQSQLFWVNFDSTSDGLNDAQKKTGDQAAKNCNTLNHKSSTSINLYPAREESRKENTSEVCHVHLNSCQKHHSNHGPVSGRNSNDGVESVEVKASEGSVEHGISGKDMAKTDLDQICLECHPQVSHSTKSDFTCSVDHSRNYPAAGHVSCSGVIPMNSNSQLAKKPSQNTKVKCCENNTEEKSFGAASCHHDMISTAQIKAECGCHAYMRHVPQSCCSAKCAGGCKVCIEKERIGSLSEKDSNELTGVADNANVASANQEAVFPVSGNKDVEVRDCYSTTGI